LGRHLSTRVCDLLDCRYPIVLAGMGGVARSELVAAITNAGGFGFLGLVREPPSPNP
jgi:nitronate monooxygenase